MERENVFRVLWTIIQPREKKTMLSFSTAWMDPEGITVNKTEKDKYGMALLICGI